MWLKIIMKVFADEQVTRESSIRVMFDSIIASNRRRKTENEQQAGSPESSTAA